MVGFIRNRSEMAARATSWGMSPTWRPPPPSSSSDKAEVELPGKSKGGGEQEGGNGRCGLFVGLGDVSAYAASVLSPRLALLLRFSVSEKSFPSFFFIDAKRNFPF